MVLVNDPEMAITNIICNSPFYNLKILLINIPVLISEKKLPVRGAIFFITTDISRLPLPRHGEFVSKNAHEARIQKAFAGRKNSLVGNENMRLKKISGRSFPVRNIMNPTGTPGHIPRHLPPASGMIYRTLVIATGPWGLQ